MKEGSGYIQLNVAAMEIFLDDGKVDMGELDRLLDIALQDGEIDPDEKRVLGRIFGQIDAADTKASVLQKIRDVQRKHGIGELGPED